MLNILQFVVNDLCPTLKKLFHAHKTVEDISKSLGIDPLDAVLWSIDKFLRWCNRNNGAEKAQRASQSRRDCHPDFLDYFLPAKSSHLTPMPSSTMTKDGSDPAREIEQASIAPDADAEQADKQSSSGSGSLTQRAAMIRDELLGNDSLQPDSVHEALSSSGTSAIASDDSSQKDNSRFEEDDLEERLNNSSIAHSLRHIALAFDEKVSRGLACNRHHCQTLCGCSTSCSCLLTLIHVESRARKPARGKSPCIPNIDRRA